MKRDDQVLALRTQTEQSRDRMVQTAKDRDRALNQNGDILVGDAQDESSAAGDMSKVIVIHPGSQNLRIGFASDALPKTVPMCLATKFPRTESEEYGNDPLPRRQHKLAKVEQQYGEEWAKKYKKMCEDMKIERRQNKHKVLPNSKELVVNFNRRSEPEMIAQHNDPIQVDWTDPKALEDPDSLASVFYGLAAQRVPDNSDPKFRLWWPMRNGWLNENDYTSVEHLHDDLEEIIWQAMKHELGIKTVTACKQYRCVFVIPDLYDKKYVEQVLAMCLGWFEFSQICFMQESIAASFGAGYNQACVIDVGAQKTSIACIDDGLILEDSRVNLKYGGYDVTETFIKMMLHDHFPYKSINLRRRHDFLLAEELKQKLCTLSQANISPQLHTFHLRVADEMTRKYSFKAYDEVLLAPMGFYDPSVFDNSTKLAGRRKLIDRSYNAYDVDMPDDPTSGAQLAILDQDQEKPAAAARTNGFTPALQGDVATPSKEKPQPFNFLAGQEMNGTPATSNAPSPAPEGASTPAPAPFVFGAGRDLAGAASPAPSGRNGGTPGPSGLGASQGAAQPPPGMFIDERQRTAKEIAIENDSILPISPLDTAVMTSIYNAAKGDEKRVKDFLGQIMVVGGGSKIPHFTTLLEEKLRVKRPDLADRVLVTRSARDMDEQVVAWKGGSVFVKLATNDSWISKAEYDMHGARSIFHKVLWNW